MKFVHRVVLWVILFAILALTLSACAIRPYSKNEGGSVAGKSVTSSYLSITLSDKVGSHFVTHFFAYNITRRKMTEVASIPMTAQYPLGVVDMADNTLYCSERDSNGCDQLVKINLTTNKRDQLTKNLFAINYMIPVDNKIIMATHVKGTTNIELASWDLQSGTLDLWNKNDHDTCVQSLTFNPYNKRLYVSLYSWKERVKKSRSADQTGNPVMPPVNHIVEYDKDGHVIRELFSTEEQIGTFVVSNMGDLAILRSAPQVFEDKRLYLIHLKTGKREVLHISNYSPTGDVFFAPDDKGIFFTAFPINDQSSNGLYYYDFTTKQVQTILFRPKSFINNFSLYVDSSKP